MEAANPRSGDSVKEKNIDRGPALSRSSTPLEKKNDRCHSGVQYILLSRIPVLKMEEVEGNSKYPCIPRKKLKLYSCTRIHSSPSEIKRREIETKLELVKQKEKSIAEYYLKMEKLINKLNKSNLKDKCKPGKAQQPHCKKVISEPMVLGQNSTNENGVTQLEERILIDTCRKAQTDRPSTFNDLNNIQPLTPAEFELEKTNIQAAIKRTKSLTLVKTKNIIAEAKKLFQNREIIRSELENLLDYKNTNFQCCKCCYFKNEKQKKPHNKVQSTQKEISKRFNGTGDSSSKSEIEENDITSTSSGGEGGKKREKPEIPRKNKRPSQEDSSKEKEKKDSKKPNQREKSPLKTSKKSSEIWEQELSKKKENITTLNKKIFELQKTCNYHSNLYNQLQTELCHFQEKIYWNQILWKQIGKLKEQVKALQQNNKQLECQKRELEHKISNLQKELKTNNSFNKKKFLLSVETAKDDECSHEMSKKNSDYMELFPIKQNAITQLKNILEIMREQENFAQRQICQFQNKINELEKHRPKHTPKSRE